ETSQSGILEGELETDLRRTVPTGCWDIIKLYEGTALALYSTYETPTPEIFWHRAVSLLHCSRIWEILNT
ncbi:MAG: hypothetical protein ACYDAP_10510, partial [Thermoplasmataceae archaeon]